MVAEPGQRLCADGTIPMAFKVTESTVAPNGVIVVNCERTGATDPSATASAVVSNSSGAGFPRIAGCTNGTGHGGIYTVGALYVVSSTTAANATGDGGGVYKGGDAAIVANTLVANRTGAGGDAGGSHGVGWDGGNGAGLYTTGNAALFNMTVADNCTGAGGMGGVPGGGEGGHGGGIWNAVRRRSTTSLRSATAQARAGQAFPLTSRRAPAAKAAGCYWMHWRPPPCATACWAATQAPGWGRIVSAASPHTTTT